MNVSSNSSLTLALALGIGLACCCAPVEPARQSTPEIGGGSLPAEVSVRPERSGEWRVAGGATLALMDDGRLELATADGKITLADEALELPAISTDGKRIAFTLRKANGFGSAVAVAAHEANTWKGPRTLVDEGTPDRVALSSEGARVAYVASSKGVAAIWVVTFDGDAPVQLTNVGVHKQGPGEPAGFVPVPDRGPPRFDGDRLVWEVGDVEHQVVLP
ncbi:MAG: hypothetical protein JRF63_08165 [Deltaproteobacteria bacterium]|nr:hypothetical protein [Deltaproteobacteria bacterium]